MRIVVVNISHKDDSFLSIMDSIQIIENKTEKKYDLDPFSQKLKQIKTNLASTNLKNSNDDSFDKDFINQMTLEKEDTKKEKHILKKYK
jgi:hypothetical protein